MDEFTYQPESNIRQRELHASADGGGGWQAWRFDQEGELWFRKKLRGVPKSSATAELCDVIITGDDDECDDDDDDEDDDDDDLE